MPRVVHFEIHAEDPGRAIRFYAGLFGWQFQKYPGPMDYWLVTTGPPDKPGIDGGLLRRQGPAPDAAVPSPVNAFPCTIDVDDIDKTIAAIETGGGTIAFPKDAIPGLAWLAYARDTEGNIFGIYQADTNAK
jgi:predicted enzyme related to lactoylglutathione lyase